jgi:LacI family transcriptional regulator
LLRGSAAPTAIFTAQNLVTIGAVRALRRLGREHEIALLGFDDFLLADLLSPGVSVVSQDVGAIGRIAAERLFARVDGDLSPPKTRLVTTSLIRRGSGEIPPPP